MIPSFALCNAYHCVSIREEYIIPCAICDENLRNIDTACIQCGWNLRFVQSDVSYMAFRIGFNYEFCLRTYGRALHPNYYHYHYYHYCTCCLWFVEIWRIDGILDCLCDNNTWRDSLMILWFRQCAGVWILNFFHKLTLVFYNRMQKYAELLILQIGQKWTFLTKFFCIYFYKLGLL